MAVRIRVNGDVREVPAGLSVEALLAHLGVAAERVAVERNEEVVRRAERASVRVEEGDAIEVVSFVGGG